jgi:pyrimidine operon attenuation protein/uracil phosphoribosyltransferase
MQDNRILILNHAQAQAKIARMACEILEQTYPEQELVLIGIDTKGESLAHFIAGEIQKMSQVKLSVYKAIPQRNGDSTDAVDLPGLTPEKIQGKTSIIIDDVLYSGKTLLKTLTQLMSLKPSRVQAMVLIDRGHRSFPIHADYTGMELGTTLQEHIRVEIAPNQEISAYLFS